MSGHDENSPILKGLIVTALVGLILFAMAWSEVKNLVDVINEERFRSQCESTQDPEKCGFAAIFSFKRSTTLEELNRNKQRLQQACELGTREVVPGRDVREFARLRRLVRRRGCRLLQRNRTRGRTAVRAG